MAYTKIPQSLIEGLPAALASKATPADLLALIDAAPGQLDTLNELAAALGDDPNFAATITSALGGKQPLHAALTALAAGEIRNEDLPLRLQEIAEGNVITDFDLAVKTGLYRAEVTALNAPQSAYWLIRVEGYNGSFVTQTAVAVLSPTIRWRRNIVDGVWGAWVQLDGVKHPAIDALKAGEIRNEDLPTRLQGAPSELSNFNDAIEFGNYKGNTTTANTPYAGYWQLTVEAYHPVSGSAYCVQTAVDANDTTQRYRRSCGNGTWSAWARIEDRVGQFAYKQAWPFDFSAGKGLVVGAFGLGAGHDLRGTIYEYGTPAQLLSKGTAMGFANGVTLGVVPSGVLYGTLTIHMHYPDASGIGCMVREFRSNAGVYRQEPEADLASWKPWFRMYDAHSILGTVSQSAGVPTGAIIERGSNANGEYTKFADGTMLCIRNGNYALNLSNAYSAWYYADINWPFPAAFSAIPAISGVCRTSGYISFMTGSDSPNGLTSVQFFVVDKFPIDATFIVRTIAIGRWY